MREKAMSKTRKNGKETEAVVVTIKSHEFKEATMRARQAAYDSITEDWLDDMEHLAMSQMDRKQFLQIAREL